MAKNEKSHNAPACKLTRKSIGTPFVCHPRFSTKVNYLPGPVSHVEKPKGKGLKGARKSLNGGKGYQYQAPYAWSDWKKAVDEGNTDKANKVFRILKAQENRPQHQSRNPECKQSLGLLLAAKNIEVSI